MPKKKLKAKPKAKPKKKTVKAKTVKKVKKEKPIGVVTHFYGEIKVAIVKFKKAVKVGTKLRYKGATSDFEEAVKSMQYDHNSITTAPKGKQVGIKVGKKVREGDQVFAA